MRRRHPIPRLWLMTDERMGEALWPALEALPRGSGVVFRHHETPLDQRCALFARIAQIATRKRLILIRAGRTRMVGEAGVHGQRGRGLRTWPAHSRREAIAGIRAKADVLFISPIFATRSHPGAPALGPLRAARIGHGLNTPLIALGGMDARRFRRLNGFGFYGWAAIDAMTSGLSQTR